MKITHYLKCSYSSYHQSDESVCILTSAMHGSAMHCSAMHCSAMHCSAMHCSAMHCSAMHCSAMHCSVMHCSAMHSSAMYGSAMHSSAIHGSAMTLIILSWEGLVPPGVSSEIGNFFSQKYFRFFAKFNINLFRKKNIAKFSKICLFYLGNLAPFVLWKFCIFCKTDFLIVSYFFYKIHFSKKYEILQKQFPRTKFSWNFKFFYKSFCYLKP